MSVLEALVQSPAAVAPAAHTYMFGASEVFLFFFIMLGPLKLLGPYYAQTRGLDAVAARTMAWKVFGLAVVAVLLAALLGSVLLRKWQIAPPVMEFAAGLVFLLVALRMVLAQYEAPRPQEADPPEPQLLRLVFPVTVTPYGVATVIVLMALSVDAQRSLLVLGFVLAVMALNLLAMLFVRPIVRGVGVLTLQIIGSVLGILQVALALQLMADALNQMGVGLTL
ncbi:MAG TPA: MarC family protein [Lysobacter sp.]